MNKGFFKTIMLLFAIFTVFSCKDDETKIEVSKVKITPGEYSITEGESKKLEATISPAEATDKTLTWASSDESIVKVDKEGLMTALKTGDATIIASSVNGIQGKSKIKVVQKVYPVESINIVNLKDEKIENLTIVLDGIDETEKLFAQILPENATNKEVTWVSSSPDVVVIANGLIRGLKEGTSTITATSVDGNKTATCEVTVEKPVVKVTAIEMSESSARIHVGDKYQLNVVFTPKDASNKNITWTNDDDDKATVDDKGLVTATGTGMTYIYATSEDGNFKASCMLVIGPKPAEVFCVDPDGKKYKTIKVGEQVWMAENYAYMPRLDAFNDESRVDTRCYLWESAETDIAKAKETDYYKKHGVLYNWQAAKQYAPQGWHLPTEEEWEAFEKALGMTDKEIKGFYRHGDFGNKLKSKEGWSLEDGGTNGSDDFGFNGKPSGAVGSDLIYIKTTEVAYYWSATTYEDYYTQGFCRRLFYSQSSITKSKQDIKYGFSVRYVKD